MSDVSAVEGRDLRVELDGRVVFRAATVECPPGNVTCLIGPSGSGKTTLLHCLGLLQRPTAGSVLIDGVDATHWSSSRRRRFWRSQAAFVLQDYGVMESESVGFNVSLNTRFLGSVGRADRKRVTEALALTGLAGRDKERAAHLSGGEKQRLAVARAIYKDAAVILVDEPTASLDDANRRLVIELFAERARKGCTVIISSHDDDVVAAADRRFSLQSLSYVTGARDSGPAAALTVGSNGA